LAAASRADDDGMTTSRMVIADIPIEPVACVRPDASLAHAARALAQSRHGVVVVEADPPWELCEGDVVDAIASGRAPTVHVRELEIEIDAPQFVGPETAAEDAAAMMIVTGHRALVVVDEGQPLGVVHLRDVVSALWGAKSWSTAFRIALHLDTTR
jgi:CBS domain-containing protein